MALKSMFLLGNGYTAWIKKYIYREIYGLVSFPAESNRGGDNSVES